MSLPPRLAFFGGTFDPIHLGHLEIARKAQFALQLDQVIFLPCRQSPHKTDTPSASDQERLEMIKIAIQDIHWAHVSDFELKKPPPSYTWETLREFKNTFRDDSRLFLILGLDQWNSLPRWKHPERLAEDVEFIVIGRDGHPDSRPDYRAHFIEGDHPASSSQIREDISSAISPRWLPKKIRTYLAQKGLYSNIA